MDAEDVTQFYSVLFWLLGKEVLGGQRCEKGVNKRIFWMALNITPKLGKECFAENY